MHHNPQSGKEEPFGNDHNLPSSNSDAEKIPGETNGLKEVWLDKQEILQRMHISDRTLQSWRSKKLLRHSKIGGKIYYSETDLQLLLKRNMR